MQPALSLNPNEIFINAISVVTIRAQRPGSSMKLWCMFVYLRKYYQIRALEKGFNNRN